MQVTGFADLGNIDEANEVANEIRRTNKALKEAVAMAQTLNNRERLFGIPVTNVSQRESVQPKNESTNLKCVF